MTPHLSSSASSPPPQVRHAGRAHVRGKYRRVWRPRYLELLDQGIVRYYEFPSTSSGQQPQHQHSPTNGGGTVEDSWQYMSHNLPHSGEFHDMLPPLLPSDEWIPKYTLQISHARILDVTTLRDMHVGLPRGSFGFIFRGQRLKRSPQSAAAAADVEALPLEVPEPRDFLCAVSTLEDAQMWVVALQWAASERHVVELVSELETLQHPPPPSSSSAKQDEPDASSSQLSTSHSNSMLSTAETMGGFVNISSPQSVTSGTSPAPSTAITTQQQQQERSTAPRGGKMVVTKVTTVRTVRVSTLQWEIAYEIHSLFVSATTLSHHPGRRAEHWTTLRTARDLWHLIHALHREVVVAHSTASNDVLRCWQQPIQDLPRLAHQPFLLSYASFHETLRNSIPVVDGILRSLVTDAIMVRTNAMKTFLGLLSPTTGMRQPRTLLQRLLERHNGQAIVERRIETIPEQSTADAHVKQWLQTPTIATRQPLKPTTQSSSSLSSSDSYAAFVLQRPLTVLGGVGVSSVAALWPLCKWAFSLYGRWMPTLSLRADALVMSWIGAAYLGYQYHQQQQQHHPQDSTTGTTTTSPRPAATRPPLGKSSASNKCSKKAERPSHGASDDQANEDEQGLEVVPAAADDDDDEDDVIAKDVDDESSDGETAAPLPISPSSVGNMDDSGTLSSPLPKYPDNHGKTCWSQPVHNIFHVRSVTYLKDKVKEPSGPAPLKCRGVDVWMTDNPERYIARHPSVLGGKLGEEDTFLVNFLLPFGNFIAYFSIPPLNQFPPKLQTVWTKFLEGDQEYRDARLKLLPVVAEGPWIVKAAVGPGKSPAVLGKVIPLQYFFRHPEKDKKGVYEVDVIITASSIAKGILSVVKGHTKTVSLAFAFIIEAAEQEELPETVLCSCQVHSLHLEQCPILPPYNLDATTDEEE